METSVSTLLKNNKSEHLTGPKVEYVEYDQSPKIRFYDMDRQQGGEKRVQKKVSSVDSDQVVCDELLRPSGGQHLKHQKQGSSLQRMSAGMCNAYKEWQRKIIYSTLHCTAQLKTCCIQALEVKLFFQQKTHA